MQENDPLTAKPQESEPIQEPIEEALPQVAQPAQETEPVQEVKPAQETEQEREALSREEVLLRARAENAHGDERQRSQMQWGNYAGFIATEFACIVIMFVYIFTGREFSPELFCILFTGISAQNIVQACINKGKKTKTVFIVCAALITACTLMYWVFWILGLCGIRP